MIDRISGGVLSILTGGRGSKFNMDIVDSHCYTASHEPQRRLRGISF